MGFRPTREMSLAKARLMKKISNNPLIEDISTLSRSKLEQLAGVKSLVSWYTIEGFESWFTNNKYIEDLMEADLELGMERLQELLSLPLDGEKGSPKPSDLIRVVEMLLKFTGRTPKNQTVIEHMDSKIDQMSEEGLDKLIVDSLKDQKKIQQDLQMVIGE